MSRTEQEIVIENDDREILREVLEYYRNKPALPEKQAFRVAHLNERHRIDRLLSLGLLDTIINWYALTLDGLRACDSEDARTAYHRCRDVLGELQTAYRETPGKTWSVEELSNRFRRSAAELSRMLTLLKDLPGLSPTLSSNNPGGFVPRISLSEQIIDTSLPEWPDTDDNDSSEVTEEPERIERIERIEITGYRPFSGFSASPGQLTVIIGANASGKSSLFDALRLLSYGAWNPLPPEIDIRGEATTALFHAGGPERLDLAVTTRSGDDKLLRYEVRIQGPVGAPRVMRERLSADEPLSEGEKQALVFLDFAGGKGVVWSQPERRSRRLEWSIPPNELALRRALDPTLTVPASFRAFVASWGFYAGFDVSPRAAMRRPAHIEENPILAEDGSNLSAVLNSLVLEHPEAWEELESHLRAAIPGFESLGVRPRGGRGMAIGIWREHGVKDELTLGDLSEGTLRLLCWLGLAFSPNLPPVICIDEPELGLHPRVLPTLAGAFKLASARAQLLIATHSPHFLSQFNLDEIAVMRKDGGHAQFVRPGTSQALRREVEEIGGEALARLFISEELEVLP